MTDTPAPSVPTSPTVARDSDVLHAAASDLRYLANGGEVAPETLRAHADNLLAAPPPVLPTSPPAGPAVSPEIDALIDDVRDALRVTDDGQALASLAAVRTEVARLTKERDEAMRESLATRAETWRQWDDLQAQIRRLQQEALTPGELFHIHEVMLNESCGCATCRLIRAKLARISAHKEKE